TAVQQDEAGAGRQEDVTREVDGTEHAGGLPATNRDATEIGVFDPPRHTARVAEVGVGVVGVGGGGADGGSRGGGHARYERRQLAVLVELADLGGGAAGLDFDHDLEAHRHLRRHLGAAVEDEAARGVGVVETVVGRRVPAIVVPGNDAVHLTGDRQG